MKEENKKKLIKLIIDARRQLWSTTGLQYMIEDPFKLDILMALLLNKHDEFDDGDFDECPWKKAFVAEVAKVDSADPVGPEQHARFWAALSTTCKGLLWSDESIEAFLADSSSGMKLASLINTAEATVTWCVDRIVKDNSTLYPENTVGFGDPFLALQAWLRPRLNLTGQTLEWKLGNLSTVSVTELGWTSGSSSSFRTVGDMVGYLRKEKRSYLERSPGVYVLQQVEQLPTHLWKGRLLYGLGDLVCRNPSSSLIVVPHLDDRKNSSELQPPAWMSGQCVLRGDEHVLLVRDW